MDKIRLEIVGITLSQSQTGAYVLILGEKGGRRRLPVVIGMNETQAIAIGMEGTKPARPFTHDLFRNFARTYGITLVEVVIDKVENGVFHAKLICLHEGKITEIDSRTSDAVALSVRFKCPIYTNEGVMSVSGMILEDDRNQEEESLLPQELTAKDDISGLTLRELEEQLEEAVRQEDYELASRIRDEIALRKRKK